MPLFPLTLVLVAALLHPAWNLLARRATAGDQLAFVWLTSVVSCALYVPVVIVLSAIAPQHLRDVRVDAAMMAGTGLLHVIYFIVLQRSYRAGEFSVVYPLARGTGPLITAVAAVALLGERLAPVQVAGVAIIIVAVLIVAGGRMTGVPVQSSRVLRQSLGYGIMTGVAIAAYTLWDKHAVAALAISPILYDFGRTAGQTLLLAPAVLLGTAKRSAVRSTWRLFRREAIGVAIVSPLAYVLVLYALTLAPVSIVAPIRESSIIVGAFVGAHVLKEGHVRRRVVAAGLMLAGIVALARG